MSFIRLKITVEAKDENGRSVKAVDTFDLPAYLGNPTLSPEGETKIANNLLGMVKPFMNSWYGKTEEK